MFDYKQRPATPEYRENWDRVYNPSTPTKVVDSGLPAALRRAVVIALWAFILALIACFFAKVS